MTKGLKTITETLDELSQFITCQIEYKNDHSYILILMDTKHQPLDDMELQVRYGWDQKERYSIHDFKLTRLSEYDLRDVYKEMEADGIKKPNNFSVPTAKKLQDWIDWYRERSRRVKIKEAEAHKLITAFKEKIKPYNVFWRGTEQRRGWIERGGLELEFEITSSGYISYQIHVKAEVNIDSYISMTNNDLLRKEKAA